MHVEAGEGCWRACCLEGMEALKLSAVRRHLQALQLLDVADFICRRVGLPCKALHTKETTQLATVSSRRLFACYR